MYGQGEGNRDAVDVGDHRQGDGEDQNPVADSRGPLCGGGGHRLDLLTL